MAWSRLGAAYEPAQLKQALEQDRTLFELDARWASSGWTIHEDVKFTRAMTRAVERELEDRASSVR